MAHSLLLRASQAFRCAVLPPRCLLCRRFDLPGAAHVCPDCSTRVNQDRTAPSCPRCAADAPGSAIDEGDCKRCRDKRPAVSRVVRVGSYGHALGPLVLAFKYDGDPAAGAILGGWLADVVEVASQRPDLPPLSDVDAIVPVPTTAWRRVKAKLHVPSELSRGLARRLHRPVVPALRRVRGGPHQIGLTAQQRIDNVRGAFALTRGTRLEGARLLLVDDVSTTGATLAECARVLRRGGAEFVCAAVLARAATNMEAMLGV